MFILKAVITWILDWTLRAAIEAYRSYQAKKEADAAIKKAASDAVKKAKELKKDSTAKETDDAIDDQLSRL